ncbi:hypothetical protein HC931_07655 [Candidatus Gracilibacteria bacterium]|nr:hypothetical protein [Candidatus Gracilibacteria bacterium]
MTTSVPAPVTSFDFTVFSPEKAHSLQEKTEQIVRLMNETIILYKQTSENCIKLGQWLIEMKEEDLEHGQWIPWRETFFPWGERTAQEFMNMARNPKSAIIADLGIYPTINRLLSRPSTPQEATVEVIDLVQKGEKVTVKRTEEIIHKHRSTQNRVKATKSSSRAKLPASTIEVIDGELESPPSHQEAPQPPSPTLYNEATPEERVTEPDEVKALPPYKKPQWWRLSGWGEEQNHLLFCGHPEDAEFLSQLPDRIGVWLSYPPSPSQWVAPPSQWLDSSKKWLGTTIHLSTNYRGINLKVVRKTIEEFLKELSSEGDDTAMLAYLSDWSFLSLLDDLRLNCYIAEPSESQCQTIVEAWQKIKRKVEKLETLDRGSGYLSVRSGGKFGWDVAHPKTKPFLLLSAKHECAFVNAIASVKDRLNVF